ncbi:hypothetical protein TNCV_904711 [Trichonephila clavipes]|nr:hypothetical protein TNCV_904711 [Trichonephila clavipes]
MGSNSGEDLDACKCIAPLRHGGTVNNLRAASPLVRLVEGKNRWDALATPRVFSLEIGVETEQNRTVTYLHGAQSKG